ncbi:polysaccharide pyruvyl transferase family protein [Sphingobacterium cellulitidis]|uniref:polysaccharide pyruvyl transferase family protein n=1 Tax=Sphingobacterium cellulitidis TaxID=1768011 RepID=UPI000B93DD52|nr:hypothetical protein CHT99_11750 [Sphingobacterium cellulitidis]
MFKSDLLFNGYYGYFNTGDDAFVEIANWGATKFWEKNDIRFLIKGNNKPTTISPVKAFPLNLPYSYEIQQNLLIKGTKAFVSAGGSTLNSRIETQRPKFLALNRKLKDKRFVIGAIGVSVGPFKTKEDEISIVKYLKNLNFLALRDVASFDYVDSLNLDYKPVLAFDLAGLLPEIYREFPNTDFALKSSSKKIICISVCNYESYFVGGNLENQKRRNRLMRELLINLDNCRNDCHFKFIIINGNPSTGDVNLTFELINKVGFKNNTFEVVPYDSSPKNVFHLISNCDLVLTIRLHAGIFACFADVPFLMVEYHKKCSDFLSDIGYDDSFRMYDFSIELALALGKINNILDNKSNYIFPKHLDLMRLRSMKNFTSILF